MSIFSVSAEFATIVQGDDLFEITDGRLRFKDGKSGFIRAKFMVTQDEGWRKIRLTYVRPGRGLRAENYVIARLNQIARGTLANETLITASSQNHVTDSDDIRAILGNTTLLNPLDFANFFYQIDIVMRRSFITSFPDEVVAQAITLSGIRTLAHDDQILAKFKEPDEKQTAETPSVPIPPPTDAERETISSLQAFASNNPAGNILTPSPEFILAQLSTTAPGFG